MKQNIFIRIIKGLVIWVLYLLLLINVFIIGSGKFYLYKALYYNLPKIDNQGIFEQRTVANGTPYEFPLATDYCKTPVPQPLMNELESLKSVAFLIYKNDSISYEKYWDGYGKDSYSNSYSMAKTVVSILIGIAIDEGKIKNVDEPVSDFLPQFKDGLGANLTIKHLLTMSSGTNWNESYINPFSVTTEAFYGDHLKKLVANMKVKDEPGKVFKYLSGNTLLLSAILEKATGMHLSDYASEKLWKPIGAANPATWALDKKDGEEKAYCCLFSNARDFARIGELYLHNGKWNGKQIVSEDYVKHSVIPADILDKDGNKIDHYGYSWWLMNRNGHAVFYAQGILSQYVIVIPDKKIVAVRLGKKRGPKDGPFRFKDVVNYVDGILEMYP